MNAFTYEGLEFTGFKQLKGKSGDFDQISKRISKSYLSPENWNIQEFYKAAKQVEADDYDLFKVNGKTVLPAQNELFSYR